MTGDERAKVNSHIKTGYEMLAKLNLKFAEVEQCVMGHHERLNGSGYPTKTSHMEFPGRLCAVVDSFCAMITNRPYSEAMSYLKASADLAGDVRYDKEITKALQVLLVVDMKMKN